MSSKHAELTILFADVADSTKLYERLGDAAARGLVAECLALLESQVLVDQIALDNGCVVR